MNSVGKHVIVGLGKTGLSCARYLHQQQIPFVAVDTRMAPPGAAEFTAEFPHVPVEFGELRAETLARAECLVMSPGVDLRWSAISHARDAGVRISGDVDIFARKVDAPIVAITGSNAKSTVTTLVGEMARAAGVNVGVAGNIGLPVLDLLTANGPAKALYVLELSSFQLETTSQLGARVATVLNLSEDHMDRYDTLEDYRNAKHRIFEGCEQFVINRDDSNSCPANYAESMGTSFGLDMRRERNTFGISTASGKLLLCYEGEPLMAASEMKIAGMHNVANALAALALGRCAGLSWAPMLQTLRDFSGLPHRCQWVATLRGVSWYNDSKGTNVGASVAAIAGLGANGPVILLAGGVGKGADFAALGPAMAESGKTAILFGEDAEKLALVLQAVVSVYRTGSLEEAVKLAHEKSEPGDVVLLSPACASLDMFRNYEHRGEVFVDAVGALH